MEEEVFSNFLKKRYEDQLQWFEAKAAAQKRRYHVLQTSVVVISSSMPVMVTMMPPTQNWITASASVMLALGTALLKMLHLPEAWINYRDTAQALRQEMSWMEFQTGVYAELDLPTARRKFIDRVEDILLKESGTWRSTAMTPVMNNNGGQSNPSYGGGGGGGGGYRPQQQQQQSRGDRGDRQSYNNGDRGERGDRQNHGGDRAERQNNGGDRAERQPPPPMQQRVPRSTEVDLENG